MRLFRHAAGWLLGTGAALALGLGWVIPARAQVLVVAGPGPGPAALAAAELPRIWRKQQQFAGGTRVQPLNLPPAHPLRRWFSQQVLGQSPEEQEAYWRDQYFNGVLPPYVLASEEAVLRFVAATPGAIGYVSACGGGDKRVRVLLQLEGGPGCAR